MGTGRLVRVFQKLALPFLGSAHDFHGKAQLVSNSVYPIGYMVLLLHIRSIHREKLNMPFKTCALSSPHILDVYPYVYGNRCTAGERDNGPIDRSICICPWGPKKNYVPIYRGNCVREK